MNPYHIKEDRDGYWEVVEGNTIIWAKCPTKEQAARIAKSLFFIDRLMQTMVEITN